MCVTSSLGIALKYFLTSRCSWASRSTRLAINIVSMVGCDIWHCTSPSFAAMSGLVWVTAYCRLPIMPRSLDNSLAVTPSWGWSLLCLGISRVGMFMMYSSWEHRMEKSGNCSQSMPANLNWRVLKAPKGSFCWERLVSTSNAVINMHP